MRKKENKKKRKISFFKILALLLLLISVFVGCVFSKIDILPTKYFLIMIGFLLFVNVLCDAFLLRKKNKTLRVIFSFVAIIIMVLMGFISYYIINTLGFLKTIKHTNYKIENYSVVVLSNSNYEKITDLNGIDLGYYSNSTGTSKANKKIKKEIKTDLIKYTDARELTNDLVDGKIKAIVVEDSVLSMINEENLDFEKLTNVIYKFSIKIKASTTAKDVNVTNEAFNIYLSGIDTYGEISSVSRSDVNFVITVNPKTKQILLTSIPRDYYVQLHGTTGTRDKLTHAGMYGVDMSISTIEDLLDININYYFKVNFTSLIDLVNALGGITVYSDYSFTSIDGLKYTKGNNKMNGEEALSFARERKSFSDGDRQRGKNQQAVISAIINKICSKSILMKYDSLLDSLSGEFQTNMGSKKITSLIKMQLNDMSSWNISTYSLNGVDSRDYTYSGGSTPLYVMEPVLGSVKEATSLIKSVIKGEKLEAVYEYDGPVNTVKKTNQTTQTPQTTQTNNIDISTDKEIDKEKTKEEEKQETEIQVEIVEKNKVEFKYPKCQDEKDGYCTLEEKKIEEVIISCEDPTLNPSVDENGIPKCTIDEDTIVEALYSCPKGYELEEKECISISIKKVEVCDSGYNYDKDYKICCPVGYKYDKSTKMCVQN